MRQRLRDGTPIAALDLLGSSADQELDANVWRVIAADLDAKEALREREGWTPHRPLQGLLAFARVCAARSREAGANPKRLWSRDRIIGIPPVASADRHGGGSARFGALVRECLLLIGRPPDTCIL